MLLLIKTHFLILSDLNFRMGNKQLAQVTKKSTSKFIVSDSNFRKLETNLMQQSGVPSEQILLKNIKVGEWLNNGQKEDIFMRTLICGHETKNLNKEKKPILLFIHGFAGSGLMFFKILGLLCKHFTLIMVDLVGMGGSSRPENFDKHKTNP